MKILQTVHSPNLSDVATVPWENVDVFSRTRGTQCTMLTFHLSERHHAVCERTDVICYCFGR